MSTLWVYIAFDGDHIGRKIGRASLNDDPEEIRRISQAIDSGNEIWRSWSLAHGGEVINIGGDEGRIRIGADHLAELPDIMRRYGDRVGATVSVGVGNKLSEADRALMAAKLQGGDQITLFTPEVEELLAQVKEKTEAEKLQDEYLAPMTKAGREPALNKPNAGGGMTGPSMAGAVAPDAPVPEGSEHSENEALQSQIENAPPQAEATNAAGDLHDQFGSFADQQGQEDSQQQEAEQAQGEGEDLKAQVIAILKEFKAKAPELEQLNEADPEMYKALTGMVQSMIAMAQQLFGGDEQPQDDQQEQPVQKAEDGFSHWTTPPNVVEAARALHSKVRGRPHAVGDTATVGDWNLETHTLGCRNAADEPEDQWWDSHYKIYDEYANDGVSQVAGDPGDGIFVTATPVLQKAEKVGPNPHPLASKYGKETAFKDLSPEAQAAIKYRSEETGGQVPERVGYADIPTDEIKQAMLTDANRQGGNFKDWDAYHQWYLQGGVQDHGDSVWPVELGHEGSDETLHDGNHRFHSYARKGLPRVPAYYSLDKAEKKDCNHFYGEYSDYCLKCKESKATSKAKLEKEALDPGKTGRHNVVLPVGSQIDPAASGTHKVGQVKVQDPESGKTKWRSVRSGIVMDDQGNPVSSRNPGG